MGRPGVSYSQVAEVCASLVAQGVEPTVNRVREGLGNTGSSGTLTPMVKQWRSENGVVATEQDVGLPSELLLALKHVYDQAQAGAKATVEQAREAAQAVRDEAQAKVADANRLVDAVNLDLDSVRKALNDERASHELLATEYQALRIVNAALQSDVSGMLIRLDDRRVEVEHLNRQISQARDQFDHYQRESTRIRAEDRQQLERALVLADSEIEDGRRRLADSKGEVTQLATTLRNLEEKYITSMAEMSAQAEQRASLEAEREELKKQLAVERAFVGQLNSRVSEATAGLTSANNEVAVLKSEKNSLTERAHALEAKIESVDSNARDVAVENAVLKSQLAARLPVEPTIDQTNRN